MEITLAIWRIGAIIILLHGVEIFDMSLTYRKSRFLGLHIARGASGRVCYRFKVPFLEFTNWFESGRRVKILWREWTTEHV